MNVEKKEVEDLLSVEIPSELFDKAYQYALSKQKYIFDREKREVVMQRWYLVLLIKEYVLSLSFQNSQWIYAMQLIIWKKSTMSKTTALPSNHIVPCNRLKNQ